MEKASKRLEFENANELLQLIHQIEHVTSVQHVDNPFAKDCDAIGLYRQADAILIALVQLREGKVIGSEHYSFHLIASNDEEAIESFLFQHYRLLSNPPREILLPFLLTNGRALAEILSESHRQKIRALVSSERKKNAI